MSPSLKKDRSNQPAARKGLRESRLPSENRPGNIREMQNVIEGAVILSQNSSLRVDPQSLVGAEAPLELNGQFDAREREAIEAALRASQWRVSGPNGAAKRLGLSHSTLEFRIKKLGIDKFQFRRKEVV
jgi:formate hydrogenlyase transcriptional activator